MMKELLEHLNKIYVDQLSNCSEICRKIVFALFAVTWGLSYSQEGVIINLYFLIVFLLLTIYLGMDALQYFLTAVRYRNHFHQIVDTHQKGENEEKIKQLEKSKRKNINDKSYRFLVTKISLLPFAVIALIAGIINAYLN